MGKPDGEVAESVSPSFEECDPLSGLDFATHRQFEMGSSSQTTPTVDSDHFGRLGEFGISMEQYGSLLGSWGGSVGAEMSTESPQLSLGGDISEVATHVDP